MRRSLILIICIALTASLKAQEKTGYKLYGFVRGELFYNSRKNVEGVDGLFNIFPLNKELDALGNDLNAIPNSNFYSISTRLGVDISGPDVGTAKLNAKIEADFTGVSATPFMLFLRQAFVNLSWKNGSSLLFGQTWHPLFGDVYPDMFDLSTGAPFQPFNRSPMIRYRLERKHFAITLAGIYQLASISTGLNGKSNEYIKYSTIPELFAGINYKNNGFLAGGGVEMISLKPRLQASVNGKTYKVDERITTVSLVANAQYKSGKIFLAGKTMLASNLSHVMAIGGYGVSSLDPTTGRQEYTPQRYSTSWLDFTYGKRLQGGLFLGYSKNLGTTASLINNTTFCGSGYNIDRLFKATATFFYNLPQWRAGFEYGETIAWYGTINLDNGKIYDTSPVNNHRLFATVTYTF